MAIVIDAKNFNFESLETYYNAMSFLQYAARAARQLSTGKLWPPATLSLTSTVRPICKYMQKCDRTGRFVCCGISSSCPVRTCSQNYHVCCQQAEEPRG